MKTVKKVFLAIWNFLAPILVDPFAPTVQAGGLNVAAATLTWMAVAGRGGASAWPLVAVLALTVAEKAVHAWAEISLAEKDVPKRP